VRCFWCSQPSASHGLHKSLRETEHGGDIDYFLSQISDRADNEYAKDLLGELHETLRKFKDRTVEAVSEAEVRDQQIKALKKAKHSALYLDHYVLVWNSNHELELRENAAAVKRGVDIKRIWVISEALLRDSNQVKTAMDVMGQQKSLGIKVSYVLQRDLQGLRDYQRFSDVDYALFDDEVLTKVAARSSPLALPSYCFTSWNRATISTENPFPFIIGTGFIKEFDDTGKAWLSSMTGRNATQSK
jgi:hypothetical protein